MQAIVTKVTFLLYVHHACHVIIYNVQLEKSALSCHFGFGMYALNKFVQQNKCFTNLCTSRLHPLSCVSLMQFTPDLIYRYEISTKAQPILGAEASTFHYGPARFGIAKARTPEARGSFGSGAARRWAGEKTRAARKEAAPSGESERLDADGHGAADGSRGGRPPDGEREGRPGRHRRHQGVGGGRVQGEGQPARQDGPEPLRRRRRLLHQGHCPDGAAAAAAGAIPRRLRPLRQPRPRQPPPRQPPPRPRRRRPCRPALSLQRQGALLVLCWIRQRNLRLRVMCEILVARRTTGRRKRRLLSACCRRRRPSAGGGSSRTLLMRSSRNCSHKWTPNRVSKIVIGPRLRRPCPLRRSLLLQIWDFDIAVIGFRYVELTSVICM